MQNGLLSFSFRVILSFWVVGSECVGHGWEWGHLTVRHGGADARAGGGVTQGRKELAVVLPKDLGAFE